MNKLKRSGTFREPSGTPAFKFIFDLKSLSFCSSGKTTHET